jgi:dihydroorotase
MSNKIHIANAFIVNEGAICKGDLIIEDEFIRAISIDSSLRTDSGFRYINAAGLYLLPGVIDDQVHFREPGLTHKADILHESRAAVAGGVTSFMDMPNTKPPTLTLELLEQKCEIARRNSMANYSFYMGISNDNADEVLKTPLDSVCGLKVFLGSSTGNLLVNNVDTLFRVFSSTKHIIAAHCEDDGVIAHNLGKFRKEYGEDIPINKHHLIRNEDSCFRSSSAAVELAKKCNARLHVFHLSTEDELQLFDNNIPLEEKMITAEVCVHHLWYSADDYETLGAKIKWNPAIKEKHHREALRKAILDGRIDVIATDHAPHQLAEKSNPYTSCPSGAPIVQFSLQMMLELVNQNVMQLADVVRLMSHNPSRLFRIRKRGFIREGWYADLVLVNLNKPYVVSKDSIFSKCGWSPLEGTTFGSTIETTFINGKIAWNAGNFDDSVRGQKLFFDRKD